MQIRKAKMDDAAGIAKVHVDSWRTTYKGMMPQSFLDRLSYDERTALWEKNMADATNEIYVAENENGQIIGFVTGGKRAENTEAGATDLTAIYLLEEWQGLGVGKQLLKQIMSCFQEQGFRKVYVDVLAANKTRHFYQYYGAEYVKNVQFEMDGETIDEELYVWNSVEAVLKKLS